MNATTNAINAETRKVLAIASLAALLALPATRLAAADLTVDSPMTVTTKLNGGSNYDNVYVNDVLTVNNGGRVAVNTQYVVGANGRIVVTDQGGSNHPILSMGGSSARAIFTGAIGTPAVTINGNVWDTVNLYNMTVSDDVTTDAAEIDFMRLNGIFSAFPAMIELRSDNAKPVVVTFNGGSLCARNANDKGFYLPNAGTKIVLRGENDCPIRLMLHNWTEKSIWPIPHSSNLGTIQTEGSGDVLFVGRDRATYGGTVSFNAPYDDPRLVWNHAGDFVFTNAMVKTTVDNALPYSETVGRTLRFGLHKGKTPTATEYSGIDLNGHSSKVGNLLMDDNTFVTNSAATAGTLVFGADGLASSFSGTVAKGVHIAKGAGAGTLTVGDAVGGTWGSEVTPTNDPAIFREATSTVGNIWPQLLAGLNLLEPQTVDVSGSLELVADAGETNVAQNVSFSGAGTLRKSGAGVARVEGAEILPASLDVAAGTLAVCGRGNTDKYYRFSFDFSNLSGDKADLGKIGLFDKDGNWVAKGLAFAGQGLAASALSAGTFTFSDGISYSTTGTYSESPLAIFNTAHNKYALAIQNLKSYKSDCQTSIFTLTARLADNANPVCWFTTYRQGDQPAKMITVESSPDGVSGWRTVSSFAEATTYNGAYYTWANDRSGGSAAVTISGNAKTLWTGAPFAVASSGDAPAATVANVAAKVAAGATLDLAAAPGVSVNAIEVDWTSLGGTIRGLAIPANGTLALVNVPAGTDVYGTPLLALDGATGAANFKNWAVTVNGRAKDCRIQLDANGALTLGAEATVITLR